jgi:sensor domain CHASE-containing protein
MNWIRKNCTVILTLAIVLGGALVTWGRVQYISTQIDKKADKESIIRELDLIHEQLKAIIARLDGVVVRQAIITPPEKR